MKDLGLALQVPADILVVDDAQDDLTILKELLGSQGYQVRPVSSGTMALVAAHAKAPDLVLLDIQMPGMDGYQVCRSLKLDPSLSEIPVIFLSSFTEPGHKLKAFEAGGADYVTKPFVAEEVLARVGVHTRLIQRNRELRDNYERLQDIERLRDGLVHMIVHDLRSPLSGLALCLDVVMDDVRDQIPPASLELLAEGHKVAERLIRLVTSVLDVSKLEAGLMELNLSECDLTRVAADAIADQKTAAGDRILVLDALDTVTAWADEDILFRVFQNLLGNAIKHTLPGGMILVNVKGGNDGKDGVVAVSDSGPGIPKDLHEKIFTKFGVAGEALARRGVFSTGLGLSFCKLAIEAHRGSIGVDSEPGMGSTFWFCLPGFHRSAASLQKS